METSLNRSIRVTLTGLIKVHLQVSPIEFLLLDDGVSDITFACCIYIFKSGTIILIHGHKGSIHLYLDTIFPAKSPRDGFCCYKKATGKVETTEYVMRLQIIHFLLYKSGPSASLIPSFSMVSSGCLLN